jgi:hypothetical protein
MGPGLVSLAQPQAEYAIVRHSWAADSAGSLADVNAPSKHGSMPPPAFTHVSAPAMA